MFYKERTGLSLPHSHSCLLPGDLCTWSTLFTRGSLSSLVCPGHSGSSIPSSVEFLTVLIIWFPSLWVLKAPYTFPLKCKCQEQFYILYGCLINVRLPRLEHKLCGCRFRGCFCSFLDPQPSAQSLVQRWIIGGMNELTEEKQSSAILGICSSVQF